MDIELLERIKIVTELEEMISEAAPIDPNDPGDAPDRLDPNDPALANAGNSDGLQSIMDEEQLIHDRSESEAAKMCYEFMYQNIHSGRDAEDAPFRSVLIIGPPGVGKTTVLKQIANRLGIEIAYFNTKLIDPFMDLIGLPFINPDEVAARGPDGKPIVKADGSIMTVKQATLQFVRKTNLENASLIFLDELNRVPPEKQDALLELIADRSVNGTPLPKLRMVWGAINPSTDDKRYKVEEMAEHFQTRFGERIDFISEPRVWHYTEKHDYESGKRVPIPNMNPRVAEAVVLWYRRNIKDRPPFDKFINPRSLDHIIKGIDAHYKIIERGGMPEEAFLKLIETSIRHHASWGEKDIKEVAGNLPIVPLMQLLQGKRTYTLQAIEDDSPEINKILQQMHDDPKKMMEIGTMINEAIRSRGPGYPKLVKYNEMWRYSKIIMMLTNEEKRKFYNYRNVITYLWTVCNIPIELRVANADKFNNDKDITFKECLNPTRKEEFAIYNHGKEDIDRAMELSKGDQKVRSMVGQQQLHQPSKVGATKRAAQGTRMSDVVAGMAGKEPV